MSESDFRELVAEMLQSWDRYRQTRSPDMLEEAEEKERTVRAELAARPLDRFEFFAPEAMHGKPAE